MTSLTSELVNATFMDCLFKEDEKHLHHTSVLDRGITINVGFHPERLEKNRVLINEMLAELPMEFKRTGGGGWSFLNVAIDKDGRQWTGSQRVMEELLLLGIAVGEVECLVPREMWAAMPGGVPYYVVGKETSCH